MKGLPFVTRRARCRAPSPVFLLIALLAPALLVACGASTSGPSAAPASATTARPLSATAQPAAITAVSPSPATATYPLTITDGAGRQVRLEKAPQRIVSYLPSNTETLYALGLADKIVGTDDFSDYPEEAKAKPKLGGIKPNLEALVAQQPDLVVTVGATPDFPTLLAPYNIPVVVLTYQDIPGTLANIDLLGKVAGKPAEAARLSSDLKKQMDAVAEKAKNAPKVRVYYELDATDPTKPYTAGPGSYIDGMIAMAGGTNIAAGATGQAPQLSAEEIVRANPQVIVVPTSSYSKPDAASPATFAARPGWEAIEAVKNGAVRGVESNLVSRPGPRLADGLSAMARAIHPELFS